MTTTRDLRRARYPTRAAGTVPASETLPTPFRTRSQGPRPMIILPVSHLDHGLTAAHVAWLERRFVSRTGFFLETVELPAELPPLTCALHGPLVGDAPVPESEVTYRRRGDRPGASRLCARPPRPTRLLTVIAGPEGEDPCVLYTAFGGPAAPREPCDPGLADGELREASRAFWAEHALSE